MHTNACIHALYMHVCTTQALLRHIESSTGKHSVLCVKFVYSVPRLLALRQEREELVLREDEARMRWQSQCCSEQRKKEEKEENEEKEEKKRDFEEGKSDLDENQDTPDTVAIADGALVGGGVASSACLRPRVRAGGCLSALWCEEPVDLLDHYKHQIDSITASIDQELRQFRDSEAVGTHTLHG